MKTSFTVAKVTPPSASDPGNEYLDLALVGGGEAAFTAGQPQWVPASSGGVLRIAVQDPSQQGKSKVGDAVTLDLALAGS